jgi:hypothetical protein
MAWRAPIPPTGVHRYFKVLGPQPHRGEIFELSADAFFIESMYPDSTGKQHPSLLGGHGNANVGILGSPTRPAAASSYAANPQHFGAEHEMLCGQN